MDTADVKSAQIIPPPVRNTYSSVSNGHSLQRGGVFSPDVNHVVLMTTPEWRVADPTSMTEIDGEKPHHIKAGIEPCTTERARIVCRE